MVAMSMIKTVAAIEITLTMMPVIKVALTMMEMTRRTINYARVYHGWCRIINSRCMVNHWRGHMITNSRVTIRCKSANIDADMKRIVRLCG